MSTNLIVSLPYEAIVIEQELSKFNIITVKNERENVAAIENLKYVNLKYKEFIEACEPQRIALRKPLDDYLKKLKVSKDTIDTWILLQKKEIGAYATEQMRIENEKRIVFAEPAQEVVILQASKTKTDFGSANVKEKPNATVTNLLMFVSTAIESGDGAFLSLILKINDSELNKFCKAKGINGKDIKYPGLNVEMIPDVRVR